MLTLSAQIKRGVIVFIVVTNLTLISYVLTPLIILGVYAAWFILTSPMLGGILDVESIVDKGSTFTVVLAAADGSMQQREVVVDADAVKASIPEVECNVLYVEDNLANTELMESVFAKQLPNIQLISTMFGALAMDLAREHMPRLILLDLGLPDISGTELLRQLKLDVATRDIPVIIVSADAVTAQIDRTLAAGAYDYLTKPIKVARLLELVQRAVGEADAMNIANLMGPPQGLAEIQVPVAASARAMVTGSRAKP